jgi:hypothetical protein
MKYDYRVEAMHDTTETVARGCFTRKYSEAIEGLNKVTESLINSGWTIRSATIIEKEG